MTFRELSIHIQQKHRANYPRLLLDHADSIIMEVGKTSKADTARQLNITPNAFSLVYQLILAHVAIREETAVSKVD